MTLLCHSGRVPRLSILLRFLTDSPQSKIIRRQPAIAPFSLLSPFYCICFAFCCLLSTVYHSLHVVCCLLSGHSVPVFQDWTLDPVNFGLHSLIFFLLCPLPSMPLLPAAPRRHGGVLGGDEQGGPPDTSVHARSTHLFSRSQIMCVLP
jgi:hypothetical protein